MHRLKDQSDRFSIAIDYQRDFLPNPARVVVKDPDCTLEEIAQAVYQVAEHAVIHEGNYLAGSPEDRYKHRRG